MGKKLRIGLLGAGRIGNLHGTNIQNFVPDAEVVIVSASHAAPRIPRMFFPQLTWMQYSSAPPQIHMQSS